MSKIDFLDPAFVAKLMLFESRLKSAGIRVKMTDGYRSYEEQDRLYARGRTLPGKKVTNVRGGYSWHNFGLAADYCFLDKSGRVTWSGPWSKFGSIARECGLEWGGDFKTILDRPHVQYRKGLTLSELRRSHRK